MAKNYYSLVVWNCELNRWEVEFGDYSLPVVRQELQDFADSGHAGQYKILKKHCRIIQTSDKQADIDSAVKQLPILSNIIGNGIIRFHVSSDF